MIPIYQFLLNFLFVCSTCIKGRLKCFCVSSLIAATRKLFAVCLLPASSPPSLLDYPRRLPMISGSWVWFAVRWIPMPGPSSLPCARLCRPCVCIDLHIDSIGMKDVTVLLCLLLGVRWVVVTDAAVSFSNGVRVCVCVWCDTDMDPCCCYLLAVEVEINLSASERVAAPPLSRCLVCCGVLLWFFSRPVCCCGGVWPAAPVCTIHATREIARVWCVVVL
jgi:hypothetical protein